MDTSVALGHPRITQETAHWRGNGVMNVKRKVSSKNGRAKGSAGKDLPLSAREVEVLRQLAGGANTPAIAKKLFISEKTVRTHIQNILRKLGMHSRLEAVVYAYKQRVF